MLAPLQQRTSGTAAAAHLNNCRAAAGLDLLLKVCCARLERASALAAAQVFSEAVDQSQQLRHVRGRAGGSCSYQASIVTVLAASAVLDFFAGDSVVLAGASRFLLFGAMTCRGSVNCLATTSGPTTVCEEEVNAMLTRKI